MRHVGPSLPNGSAGVDKTSARASCSSSNRADAWIGEGAHTENTGTHGRMPRNAKARASHGRAECDRPDCSDHLMKGCWGIWACGHLGSARGVCSRCPKASGGVYKGVAKLRIMGPSCVMVQNGEYQPPLTHVQTSPEQTNAF